jgi:hypothetical protein
MKDDGEKRQPIEKKKAYALDSRAANCLDIEESREKKEMQQLAPTDGRGELEK